MFDVLLANSHALKKFSFRLDFDGQNTYFPGAASDREIKVISGAVKNLDKLEDLEIDFINTAHHFAGDGALRCLMSSFKKMLNIRHLSLNIEHNSFDDDQFEALFFRISDFKKIKNLELNVSRSIWLSDFSIVTAHLEKMTGLEALKITARAVNGEPEDFPEMLDSLTHLTEASFRLPFFDPHHADPQRRTRNADVEQKLSVIRDRRLKKELREREETFKQAVVARPRQKRRLGG
ncbi:hypothetical protein MB84_29250 (plasmid) [Pandoraea oxalativorans]|uniref:Uncharacterized protein n=2 Tax=Pandoraea oxalativorans TaxID=573737 RepID=A0A0G3ICE4_9BURK|nr:hypothetical protein MB84_29250 [Pandoraea oxalativorans]